MEFTGNEISSGHLSMDFGSIIGNKITNPNVTNISCVYIYNTLAFTGDTLRIIGNMLTNNRSAYEGIYFNSIAEVFDIRNNWIVSQGRGISVANAANQSRTNKIHNNSISLSGSSTLYGISISNNPANATIEIMNNLIDETGSGSTYGIADNGGGSGQTYVYWNSIDPAFTVEINGSFTFSGNNTTSVAFTFGTNGQATGAPGLNGGNPAPIYYDLNLTRNDAGCYGGSYSLSNFLPIFSGSARVYFVDSPQNIRQGNSIRVTGKSYDR